MNEHDRIEVDVWERYRQRLKREHMQQGLSADKADEKATKAVRKEIRG